MCGAATCGNRADASTFACDPPVPLQLVRAPDVPCRCRPCPFDRISTVALQMRDGAANSGDTFRMANGYGMAIQLDPAKRIAAGAIAEAGKKGWAMAGGSVGTAGGPRLFLKKKRNRDARAGGVRG